MGHVKCAGDFYEAMLNGVERGVSQSDATLGPRRWWWQRLMHHSLLLPLYGRLRLLHGRLLLLLRSRLLLLHG